MPLYRYKCTGCGEEFSRLVNLGKENKLKCVKCGSSQLEKLLPRFISGRTKEGTVGGISSCATCQAPSCATCHR